MFSKTNTTALKKILRGSLSVLLAGALCMGLSDNFTDPSCEAASAGRNSLFPNKVFSAEAESFTNTSLSRKVPGKGSLTQKKKKVYTVAIDAGHQAHANVSTEPIGPGSSTRKYKVSAGTRGVTTKVPEYKLTLKVSKKIARELRRRGYKVYMVRTTHNVNISNRQRAQLAYSHGADIFLRIHANGSASSATKGMETLCMSSSNPYNKHLYRKSNRLSNMVLNYAAKAAGAPRRYVSHVDNMSGINWSRIPVTIFEIGYMTNPSEDVLMEKNSYQHKIAVGTANGIDAYFRGK